ncbi:hypothetical protein [Loktanella sp. M215]|uniref:hypothetical protein n=1 Tax=Loktanella sp. M215 TaxID=2675431 RepID=UPI001F283005|nr:hypothetical protein [Loktanella sp. M215]MCF7700251.1 hypothetical protein [Loktanella sp. M215]
MISIVKPNLSADAALVETQKQTMLTPVVPVYNEESSNGPFLDAMAMSLAVSSLNTALCTSSGGEI